MKLEHRIANKVVSSPQCAYIYFHYYRKLRVALEVPLDCHINNEEITIFPNYGLGMKIFAQSCLGCAGCRVRGKIN